MLIDQPVTYLVTIRLLGRYAAHGSHAYAEADGPSTMVQPDIVYLQSSRCMCSIGSYST